MCCVLYAIFFYRLLSCVFFRLLASGGTDLKLILGLTKEVLVDFEREKVRKVGDNKNNKVTHFRQLTKNFDSVSRREKNSQFFIPVTIEKKQKKFKITFIADQFKTV